MAITLTVVTGPHAGKVFTLDRHDTFVVGRAEDAHLCLPEDPYFSRHHLLIEANPPLCRLTDMDSRNGTLVNNVRVKTAELRDGDEVSGGRTALRVTISLGTVAAPTTLPEVGAAKPPTWPAEAEDFLRQAGLGSPPPQPGARATLAEVRPMVPGYRDLTEVGRGGMGVVYRAVRASDGCLVAIKTIRPAITPQPADVTRFLREARVLAALTHPRVVACHESGESGGLLYFVMEFVEGTDAARLVQERGSLPLGEAVGIVAQLCEALAFAHARGFVHRDVKPANLLLARGPGGWEVKLADFGLAKAYQGTAMSGLTVSGSAAGTPAFMPPEQVTDFKTARPEADQFSAAATAFTLLSGASPFGGSSTAEVLRKVLAGQADRLEARRPDAPKALADAIHRALAVRPGDRFPNITAFAAALCQAAK